MVIAMTVLCPVSLLTLVALAVAAVTVPMRKRRPTRSTVFSAASLASLCIAIPLYLATLFISSPWDTRLECGRHGAGEFVNLTESLFPPSFVLECTERTVQLVPAGANPALLLLIAATVGFAVAAIVAHKKSTR
ncbi:hypothetical protein K3N28_09910 [Glycomyces sp. TRM65418]|uniref:hypothetical protein n=1 Tax=Glycomyces sp. TRM65418 TaxID=2867006 RepID=UPI001CE6901D|nr:hypothetical protein [Glycomyces sp. TRM65418]MCC3763387.1 hypothetical protein [Glycomyces sp. TRM65418]QZD57378.1 hypothetical protein K3N28_09850 [Glycomyces sp. TRM65418]